MNPANKNLNFGNTDFSAPIKSMEIDRERSSQIKTPQRTTQHHPTNARGGASIGAHVKKPRTPIDVVKERDGRSVIVRNLDYNVTDAQLTQLFQTTGNVLSVTIPSNGSGQHKGYAYVELDTVEARERAISSLTGSEISNRQILVQPKRTNSQGFNKKADPAVMLMRFLKHSMKRGKY
ncbi:RNA-binding protein SGN1 [Entamoeba marina]